jgi:hypothetical protein
MSRSQFQLHEEENYLLPLRKIELRFLSRPACILIADRLSYRGSLELRIFFFPIRRYKHMTVQLLYS